MAETSARVLPAWLTTRGICVSFTAGSQGGHLLGSPDVLGGSEFERQLQRRLKSGHGEPEEGGVLIQPAAADTQADG